MYNKQVIIRGGGTYLKADLRSYRYHRHDTT